MHAAWLARTREGEIQLSAASDGKTRGKISGKCREHMKPLLEMY